MITITDWLAAKIISKSWAEQIDQNNVPNASRTCAMRSRTRSGTRSNDYHYPWQSGMTGIGYNKGDLKAKNKPEPKSLRTCGR